MFRKRIKSFQYAWQGLAEMFARQPNVRVHFSMAVLALALGLFLGMSPSEWAVIALTMGFVIAMEAVNTAIEYLTDLVSPEHNPLAGKVKDVAAAGVLIAATSAATVGVLLYLPKLYDYLAPFFTGAS